MLSGINMWLNAEHQACCASCIKMAQLMLCIMHQYWLVSCTMHQICSTILCTMAQCCASIKLIDVHQGSVWLNAIYMHQASIWLNCSASGINMAQCCAWHQVSIIAQWCLSGINVAVHHASIMAQCCASMAQWCASGISMVLCIRHHYDSIMCIGHCYSTIMAQCCASIWLNFHASGIYYGSMLCIRHH